MLRVTVYQKQDPAALLQWASVATASSEWDPFEWNAGQATGAPDANRWSSLAPGTVEWLELSYTTPVQPTVIRVVEIWSPGSIVKVDVKDVAGQFTTVYTALVTTAASPRTLEIQVAGVMAKVVAVRITVDQSAHGDWDVIDAVQLIGHP